MEDGRGVSMQEAAGGVAVEERGPAVVLNIEEARSVRTTGADAEQMIVHEE